MQVWSGMCALLEGAIERYEHQTRLSQQFHSKFLRLVTHSEDKLSRLSRENEELRAEIRELRAELSGKSSAVTALTREVRSTVRMRTLCFRKFCRMFQSYIFIGSIHHYLS